MARLFWPSTCRSGRVKVIPSNWARSCVTAINIKHKVGSAVIHASVWIWTETKNEKRFGCAVFLSFIFYYISRFDIISCICIKSNFINIRTRSFIQVSVSRTGITWWTSKKCFRLWPTLSSTSISRLITMRFGWVISSPRDILNAPTISWHTKNIIDAILNTLFLSHINNVFIIVSWNNGIIVFCPHPAIISNLIWSLRIHRVFHKLNDWNQSQK